MNDTIFEPGDIFFVKDKKSKLARVVAWFMDFEYSHSGLILEVTPERIYTCETSDFEVAFFPFSHYLYDPNIKMEVLRLPVAPAIGVEIAREAAKYQRTVYGYLQLIVSFSIRELVRKVFRRTIPNFIRQGMVCCHVVLYGCKKSGIKELEELDVESIQTKETYDLLKRCGAKTLFLK
jgi:hypothetical protein